MVVLVWLTTTSAWYPIFPDTTLSTNLANKRAPNRSMNWEPRFAIIWFCLSVGMWTSSFAKSSIQCSEFFFTHNYRSLCLLYICYKIQGFCIPDMNTCTCPLSHPLLEHLCIFHADYLEVFPLESLRQQCNQGGHNKTFWR